MTLLVKDANTTTQPISTQADVAGNLVPVHAPAAVVGGVATPVGPTAPLPVVNTAGGLQSTAAAQLQPEAPHSSCSPASFRATDT